MPDVLYALPTAPRVAPQPKAAASVLSLLPGETAPILTSVTDTSYDTVLPDGTQTTMRKEGISGVFAGTRAARITHQHSVGLWKPDAAAAVLAAGDNPKQPPDLTTDQLDQAWADFQLFSYLPARMTLSREQFNAWMTPSRRAAALQAALPACGIRTGSTLAQEIVTQTGDTPLIPNADPFAQRVSAFCTTKAFSMSFK